MFRTIKRIIDICGSYKKNLVSGIIFSFIHSLLGCMSLFAILYILVNIKNLTSSIIFNGFIILFIGFIGQFTFKWLITIKMTGNGFYVYAEKRLQIGEELKKAPMGYFNDQTLGDISAALTSSMTFLGSFSMVAVFDIASGFVIMVTGYLFLGEEVTFPIAVLFLTSAFTVYQHMKTMGNSAFLLPMIESALDRLDKVIDIPKMSGQYNKLDTEKYDIEMSNVSFGYEKEGKIIKNVSLKIPEGSKTAIIGPSGCGKTTLCSLMMRFWDVDSGSVKFAGEDVKDISTDSLMSHISTVFQKVYLFHDTIENNIKFGKSGASHKEVIEAAKKACCYDFIMKLPKCFDTVVGESGSTLSGGEKQRISIARAILKDSSIVILDEATSSVDPENEHELLRAIDELTKDKTVISIAHRISTVKEADQIIVMNNGKIDQIGTHDELILKEGIYKRFIDIRQKSLRWQV